MSFSKSFIGRSNQIKPRIAAGDDERLALDNSLEDDTSFNAYLQSDSLNNSFELEQNKENDSINFSESKTLKQEIKYEISCLEYSSVI